MAREVEHRLRNAVLGFPVCDPQDLVSVADAAATLGEAVIAQFRQTIVDSFPLLKTAQPNFAHQALAWLLLEGAVVVASANYDTCIERAAPPERIDTVVTNADYKQGTSAVLLKIHGCATRRDSLLASTTDLAAPSIWAEAEVHARLSSSTMVFLGMGDPPEYVRTRLARLIRETGSSDFFVVSPSIRTNWANTKWSALVGDLEEDRKLAFAAASFLDQLVREYVRLAIERVDNRAKAIDPEGRIAVGWDFLRTALAARSGTAIIGWLRSLTIEAPAGQSVTNADATLRALLGISALASSRVVVDEAHEAGAPLRLLLDEQPLEILISVGSHSGSEVEAEARRRSTQARYVGQARWGAERITVLCSGQLGPLGHGDLSTRDIVAEPHPADLLDGPAATVIHFVSVEDALEVLA